MPVYLVTTFHNYGENSDARIRVRPLSGQGLDGQIRVECSRAMRNAHEIGTIFKLSAKLTNREGGKPFLVAPHTAHYEILSREEARKFIKRRQLLALAEAVQERREKLKLSRKDFARKCGFHESYIGKLEAGKGNPTFLNLRQIAAGLDIPVSKLTKVYDGHDPM